MQEEKKRKIKRKERKKKRRREKGEGNKSEQSEITWRANKDRNKDNNFIILNICNMFPI